MSGIDATPEIAAYYPNVIGRAFPGSKQSCAILIEGRDDGSGEVMVRATEKLVKRGVRILSQKGYVSETAATFTLLLHCQLSDESLDDIVIEMRKIKHVTNAQSVAQKAQLFDGMLFPLLLMDSDRIVAISPSVIYDMQEKITSVQENNLLLEVWRRHGVDIVNSIKQKFATRPDGKRNEDVNIPVGIVEENIVRYLKATGWGRLIWDHGTTLERVLVHDPPTPRTGSEGVSGNRMIEGLVSGLTEGILGKRFSVVEDHYDATRRVLTIGMVETSVAMKMEDKIQRPILKEKNMAKNELVKPKEAEETTQKQEVIATPVIGSSKLHMTYSKRGVKQPTVEKEIKPAVAATDTELDSIAEQKKNLENRTKELELLIKEVEKRITKTKEGLEENDVVSDALDNTAALAAKYLNQIKESEKSEGHGPIQLPARQKIMLDEDEVFAQEDEI